MRPSDEAPAETAGRRWAALAGHVLERANIVGGALVEVYTTPATCERFVVPEGTFTQTLDEAARALVSAEGGVADAIVALGDARAAIGDAGRAWVVACDGDRIEVARSAPAGPLAPRAFAAALRALARGAAASPASELGALEIADARESEAVLALSGHVGPAADETPLGRLRRHADLAGGTVRDQNGRSTVGEIVAEAERLAVGLAARGVGRGGVVGLHLRRTRDEVIGRFAAWMLGAAFVPLDPKHPPARLGRMLANARADVVLSDAPGALAAAAGATPVVAVADAKAPSAAGFTPDLPGAGDLAYILYTSGSTGEPKGVEISHGGLANLMRAMHRTLRLTSDDVICGLASFSFDMSVPDWLLPFWVGCHLVIASEDELEEPSRVAAMLADATLVQATPTRYRQLVDAGFRPSPRLKCVIGGEACTEDLARALLASAGELWNFYGPTEVTVWATAHRVTAPDQFAIVGRPLDNVAFRVVDRCQKLAPREFPGELLLGGHNVGLGYRGRDDLTRERFVDDPTATSAPRMYRTGDAVSLGPDGRLAFFGRLDSQVKIRGHRVELEEVEAALRRLPGVRASAAKVDETGGVAKLVGYVVTDGPPPPGGEMKAALRKSLPEYMVPTVIEALAALPTTRAGKLDRLALPAPAAGGVAPGPGDEASPLERAISSAVAEVFGLPMIGLDDDFTDLGGFSLARAKLVGALRKVGVTAALPDVYTAPSARALAGLVAAGRAKAAGAAGATRVEVPGVGVGWPTSGIQQKMYLDCVATKVAGQWQVVLALALHEHVDAAKLRAAFARVFARHEAFRCSFHLSADGALAQVPRAGEGFEWEDVAADLPGGGIVEYQRSLLGRSFDFESGVMNRFSLVSTPEEDRLLFWITHEIVGDAWSTILALREVEIAYAQLTSGAPGDGRPAAPTFSQHLDRVREEARLAAAKVAQVFGAPREDEGAEADRAVDLPAPVDALRRRLGVPRGTLVPTATGEALAAPMPFAGKLAEACRRFDVTPSVIVQSATMLALMKSDDERLRLGVGRAAYGMYAVNRSAAEERSVGHFSTFFPLAATAPDGASAREWLTTFRRSLRDLLSVESAYLGDILRRAPAEVVRRAIEIQFADDGYPWFLDEAAEGEKIFDFLTPYAKSHVRISIVAMTKAPFFFVLRCDASQISDALRQKFLADVFAMGERLVSCAGDERVRDWLG